MINIKRLQEQNKKWVSRNFNYSEDATDPLLGIVEEVGELSHAFLKRKQKIRGTEEEHDAAIKDALGDIFVYMMDFCNREGIDLEDTMKTVWDEVNMRDWNKHRAEQGTGK